jgi:asparagine synthase (glutamine-hydrolysing)
MSGIFGVIDVRRNPDISRIMAAMRDRMSHRPWYRSDLWRDPAVGIGLGRLGIGILNPEPQPVISRNGDVVLFLTGEFFDWEGAPAPRPPAPEAALSQAEVALRLYELYGPDCVRHLAGAFVIAVYDRARQKFYLMNDRFGLYPHYLGQRDENLIFAPEVKGVLQGPFVTRRLDTVALAQYMRFQQLLGTRTFFEDVQLLPYASMLSYDLATAQCRIEPYWSFDEVSAQPAGLSFAAAAEETTRLMRLAVERRLRGPQRCGIYLSGGLDSRTILAASPRNGSRPPTLTFGLRECRDVYYARRIAERAHAPHFWFEFCDGQWVKDYVEAHLELTEGFHSWIHMHGISTLEMARGLFEVNLSGFAGDQILGGGGHSIPPALSQAPDDAAYLAHLFSHFNQHCSWPGITEAEEKLLYTGRAYAHVAGLAFDSLRQEAQPYLKFDRSQRADYFIFTQSDLHHFYHFVTFTRSYLDVRLPFLDYDLTDFLWSLPTAFREHRKLEVAVLNRLDPALAWIPMDSNEFLPTERRTIGGLYNLWQKSKQRFNKHIYPLFRERFTLHSDYEGWLRGGLREWAEEILFDPRTLDRGIFDPGFVRSIWARHQSGLEQWTLGKIAPLMTYEMMLRRFVDAP